MTEAEVVQLIADTKQHFKDGMIYKWEMEKRLAELEAQLKDLRNK